MQENTWKWAADCNKQVFEHRWWGIEEKPGTDVTIQGGAETSNHP